MFIKHCKMKKFYYSCLFRIIILLAITYSVNGHKCYVCTNEEECLMINENNKNKYERQCLPGAEGCSTTIINDVTTSRSCEEISINDCQIANRIKYCYCRADLCNGGGVHGPLRSRDYTDLDEDGDEDDDNDSDDDVDGSGVNVVEDDLLSIAEPTVTPYVTGKSNNNANTCSNTAITTLILQYCIIHYIKDNILSLT